MTADRRHSPAAGLTAAARAYQREQTDRRTTDELLDAAYRDGWSFRDIAKQVGLSHASVRNRILAFRKSQTGTV